MEEASKAVQKAGAELARQLDKWNRAPSFKKGLIQEFMDPILDIFILQQTALEALLKERQE